MLAEAAKEYLRYVYVGNIKPSRSLRYYLPSLREFSIERKGMRSSVVGIDEKRKVQQVSRRNTSHLLRSRTILYAVLLVSSVALLTFVFFRQKPLEYYDRTEYLLGTYVTVRVSSSKMSPVTLAEAAMAEMERIDDKFGSRSNGVIAELNRSGELHDIDKETSFLIKSALEIARNTGAPLIRHCTN